MYGFYVLQTEETRETKYRKRETLGPAYNRETNLLRILNGPVIL